VMSDVDLHAHPQIRQRTIVTMGSYYVNNIA